MANRGFSWNRWIEKRSLLTLEQKWFEARTWRAAATACLWTRKKWADMEIWISTLRNSCHEQDGPCSRDEWDKIILFIHPSFRLLLFLSFHLSPLFYSHFLLPSWILLVVKRRTAQSSKYILKAKCTDVNSKIKMKKVFSSMLFIHKLPVQTRAVYCVRNFGAEDNSMGWYLHRKFVFNWNFGTKELPWPSLRETNEWWKMNGRWRCAVEAANCHSRDEPWYIVNFM